MTDASLWVMLLAWIGLAMIVYGVFVLFGTGVTLIVGGIVVLLLSTAIRKGMKRG